LRACGARQQAADIADERLSGTITALSQNPRKISSRVVQHRVADQANSALTLKVDHSMGADQNPFAVLGPSCSHHCIETPFPISKWQGTDSSDSRFFGTN